MNPRRRRHRRIARKRRRITDAWLAIKPMLENGTWVEPAFVDKIRSEYAAEITDYCKKLEKRA